MDSVPMTCLVIPSFMNMEQLVCIASKSEC